MWFITQILGFLSGGFVDRLLGHFEKKQALANDKDKIKADVVVEAIKANLDERRLMTEQLRVEHGWAVTRWIRPSFAYPLAVYFTSIIIDSMFHFGWNIAAMPDTMMEWSGRIISFYFLGRTVEKVAAIVANRMGK